MDSPRLAARASPVQSQTALAPPYFLTEVQAPDIAARVRPGQFVMVRVPGIGDPLLGRPFSVFGAAPATNGAPRTISLLYNVVGRGTALLAARRPGEHLLVLGPLGHGFDVAPPLARRALLVAGGIGIAAFGLLAEELVHAGVAVELLYGARSAADLVLADEFARLGCGVQLATDDGSRGRKGFVTSLLEDALGAPAPGAGAAAVYACGPSPMLAAVRHIALTSGVRAQLALEARMACGFGVCLGCAIPSATAPGTYRLVCTDGPCLDATEVLP